MVYHRLNRIALVSEKVTAVRVENNLTNQLDLSHAVETITRPRTSKV